MRAKKNNVIAALFIVGCSYFIWSGYTFGRAFFISDWVLETLEDHTNKPKNESDYHWLDSRNSELNAWNPISDKNIELARLDVELSLAGLYFSRLSDGEVSTIRSNALGHVNSIDPDIRTIGKLLQTLLDLRASTKSMNPTEIKALKLDLAKQTRSNVAYFDNF